MSGVNRSSSAANAARFKGELTDWMLMKNTVKPREVNNNGVDDSSRDLPPSESPAGGIDLGKLAP